MNFRHRRSALLATLVVCVGLIAALAIPVAQGAGIRGTSTTGSHPAGGSGGGGGSGGSHTFNQGSAGAGAGAGKFGTAGSAGAGFSSGAASARVLSGTGNTAHTGFSGAGTTFSGTGSTARSTLSNNSGFHSTITGAHTPTFSHVGTSNGLTGVSGVAGTAGSTHLGSTFHAGSTFHNSNVPIHNGLNNAAFHNGIGTGPHFHTNLQNSAILHSGIAHSGLYHQAFIGNHPVNLAYAGYHPSFMNHSFYHGPWSGNSFGWGWGWGPGFGLGFGGGGWGIGIGSGWGYGGYGGYGSYGYCGYPLGWGFGGWGLGSLAYSCGYNPYYNPYYVPYSNPNVIVYNYSNPIPVATQANPGATVAAVDPSNQNPEQPLPQDDNPDFNAARDAFQQGNYDAALASVDAAVSKVPSDAVLHEFRALVLFARQDFKQAAAVVDSVLVVGLGWDWTTMSSLYPNPDLYTQQLRALEDYSLANPRAADSHFLLAYHYLICKHKDAAANQLQQVTRLMPSDKLAGELLKMVQGPPAQSPAAQPPNANDPAANDPGANDPGPNNAVAGPEGSTDSPQLPAIDKDLLPGTWSASRDDGSKFRLTMTDDGKFTWKYAPSKQKGEEFNGSYTVDGPVLVLERQAGGGALAGTATFDGNGKFNFKMVGGPPEDKGLDFNK